MRKNTGQESFSANPSSFRANRLVLIDGHALLHRAYHAIPPLTTKKGELVNAVFGFTNMLLKVIADLKPSHLIVCFDRPVPTFRHKEFPQYQAQRPAMPQELKKQTEQVREVVKVFGIPIYEQDGYEADDVIGSLARQATKDMKKDVKILGYKDTKEKSPKTSMSQDSNIEVIIVTGDRDIFQLITSKVRVYAPKRGLSDPEVFDQKKFEENYGFKPQQLVDFKALAGDSSDNYPGVAGIGPKTATELIQKYGSLDKIYRRIGELPPRIAEKLKKDKKWARLSFKLAKIETETPVSLDLKKCKFGDYEPEEVDKLFEKLEFKSLVKRLPGVEEQKEEQMALIE